MMGLLFFTVIIGFILSTTTGLGILAWIVAGFIFICGAPLALISSFVDSKIDRAQDRADEREYIRQEREDERMMRYLEKFDEVEDNRVTNVYIDKYENNDNRQIHYHERKKTRKMKNAEKGLPNND